jgi:hypothetical protein
VKDRVAAILSCRDPTARLAKHQAEWTEGSLEATCTTTQWKNVAQGIVPYSGDKLKGQNGFGAGTVYTYECDYDTQHDTVLAVRVQPGQLPSSKNRSDTR